MSHDVVDDHDSDDKDNGDDGDEDFPRGSHTGTSAPSQRWKSALSQLRSKAETRWIGIIFKTTYGSFLFFALWQI